MFSYDKSILMLLTDLRRKRFHKSRLSHRAARGTHNTAAGLIYITQMYFGVKQAGSECGDQDTYTDVHACLVNGFDEWDFKHVMDCNGRYECEDAAIPVLLSNSNCSQSSEFLHIDYQCIEGRLFAYQAGKKISKKSIKVPKLCM